VWLAREYIYGLQGLVGTAYGTMLLTKIVLMVAALCLGAMNFTAGRRWRATGQARALISRVPVLVEAEAVIGICILMAAAAFTGQPPAVDVQPEWATPREVAWVFAPKKPQFTMPPYKEMEAQSTLTLDAYSLPTPLEKVQSDFNHNVSGSIVMLAGLGAVLNRIFRVRWARHWPLAFILIGVFILIVGEPTVWPMGPEGFWSTLRAPEVLMHRLAVVMAVSLALFEWRVSVGGLGKTGARYVFPAICLVGGALLLAHSHSIFVTKWAFLIEVSHNALGILAVLAGATRWMELRLPQREGRLAGVVWPVCLVLVGAVLLFYRET
jgi:copper resistance protein D